MQRPSALTQGKAPSAIAPPHSPGREGSKGAAMTSAHQTEMTGAAVGAGRGSCPLVEAGRGRGRGGGRGWNERLIQSPRGTHRQRSPRANLGAARGGASRRPRPLRAYARTHAHTHLVAPPPAHLGGAWPGGG